MSSLLERIVARTPMDGHDGHSGARLERVVLDDGRRMVLKHVDPATDLAMRLSGDHHGREATLWETGMLDRLPTGVGHTVVDVVRGERISILMRDVSHAVLRSRDPLDAHQAGRIVGAMRSLHRTFAGVDIPGLCDLDRLLSAFHPHRLRALAEELDNPLPGIALRGWEALADLLPGHQFDAVERTADDPSVLTDMLRTTGTTLLHADPWPVNIALDQDQVVFLDWGVATAGPPALDFALFLWGALGSLTVNPDAVVEEYRGRAAPGELAPLDACLFAVLVLYGWDKAALVANASTADTRQLHLDDLHWWAARADGVETVAAPRDAVTGR